MRGRYSKEQLRNRDGRRSSRVVEYDHHRNVAVKWNTEHEDNTDYTTNHGEWVKVSHRRSRKGSEIGGRQTTRGDQKPERYMTWRDKEHVTTFYFSRFPEEIRESDLWKLFQKWGRVREVFIPRYRNKVGHRFGFVRFIEVVDERRLERQLDNNIFIGGMKLFVNSPKFDRGKMFQTNLYEEDIQKEGKSQVKLTGKQHAYKNEPGFGRRQRSYAEVAKEATTGEGSSYMVIGDAQDIKGDRQRKMVLSPTREDKEWLQRAWVGRLKNRGMFERLEEELKWTFEHEVQPCYWVDDWVILPYLDDIKAKHMINEERKHGSSPISELQKWSPDIKPDHRLTWVLLWGLPPAVWKPEYMATALTDIGEMVEVDAYVEDRKRMDVARILVRTKRGLGFQENVRATIEGEDFDLKVVEDLSRIGAPPKCCRNNSWFPPSPLSTLPNTPCFVGDGSDDSDGGAEDVNGGPSNLWEDIRQSQARCDHWVQALGHSTLDRSDSVSEDVDQSMVNKGESLVGACSGADFEPHNGRLTQSGNGLLTRDERQKMACMQIEKSAEKKIYADERQKGQFPNENMESLDIDPVGGKKMVCSLEEAQETGYDRSAKNKGVVNAYSGLHVSKEDVGVLGQKQIGPSISATKVYVRRKVVSPSYKYRQYVVKQWRVIRKAVCFSKGFGPEPR